ncbi:major facilitator superfamily domain-containing protein [Trichophaea hybrida]|nr:major facilitator superfamily domain-containing protein [Trichophaea hybrida]
MSGSVEKDTLEHVDHAGSSSSDIREAGFDEVYEKKLIHKVDWRLLPMLGALYSVALIDRINMSNAAVAGMDKDLELVGTNRYSIALLIFFIPYFIFELPSNILLRKVGAAALLSTLAVSWGVVMIGMGFLKDWRLLVLCRAILGFFEAGFFPGAVYIVSSWYVRYEVQKRLAGFYLISVMVSGFSAILAYGLMQMHGIGGLAGWRWIFIVEGIITVVLGFMAYFVVIDFPDKILTKRNGNFLTANDIELLKARIDHDRDDSVADEMTWAKLGFHLRNWKLWVFALMFMCSAAPVYAFGYFLPQVLRASLCTPYLFACCAAFGMAALADKMHKRGPIIVIQNLLVIFGLLLTTYAKGTGLRYFGIFIGLTGGQGNIPAVLSYQSNNIRMSSKRSVGSALQVGFGAIGGIYASTVFRDKDKPGYMPGMWATIATQIFTMTAVAVMTWYFKSENKKQKQGKVLEDHPEFTYTL